GDEAQASLAVREDANHPRSSLQFLVETLQAVRRADAPPMRLREREARQRRLDADLDPFRHRRMRGTPALHHLLSERKRPLLVGRREDRLQVSRERRLMLPSYLATRVPQEVHLATLPTGALEVPLDGGHQALVIIAR